jgi:hypothetical protein
MIDWGNLAANALWILGCAAALAVLSYAGWQASLSHDRMGAQMSRPSFQAAICFAGLLFSLGMAFTTRAVYTAAAWAILAALMLALIILAWRRSRQARSPQG